jgi:hypothetical protein
MKMKEKWAKDSLKNDKTILEYLTKDGTFMHAWLEGFEFAKQEILDTILHPGSPGAGTIIYMVDKIGSQEFIESGLEPGKTDEKN